MPCSGAPLLPSDMAKFMNYGGKNIKMTEDEVAIIRKGFCDVRNFMTGIQYVGNIFAPSLLASRLVEPRPQCCGSRFLRIRIQAKISSDPGPWTWSTAASKMQFRDFSDIFLQSLWHLVSISAFLVENTLTICMLLYANYEEETIYLKI